ncbi:MAG: hypothetical protein AAGL89_17015 [Pseudomonadota bacterium]
MANFATFLSENTGGFITGGVVAVLQLVMVYLLLDRSVKSAQTRAEAKKWENARLELDATLLLLSSSLTTPLAHYTVVCEQRVGFRTNCEKALQHVVDKSRSFDATLAIYSVGLEASSFTPTTQLADRLRATALDAAMALANFQLIHDAFQPVGWDNPVTVTDIKLKSKSINVSIPTDPRLRAQKVFGIAVLRVLDGVSEIASDLSELAQRERSPADLNRSAVFERLYKETEGETTAFKELARLRADLKKVREVVLLGDANGITLTHAPEIG